MSWRFSTRQVAGSILAVHSLFIFLTACLPQGIAAKKQKKLTFEGVSRRRDVEQPQVDSDTGPEDQTAGDERDEGVRDLPGPAGNDHLERRHAEICFVRPLSSLNVMRNGRPINDG